jgi:multisubunit Na+/H+ antiporter MnhB subunit
MDDAVRLHRKDRAIAHMRGVARVALLNFLALLAIAVFVPLLGTSLAANTLPNGIFPKLASYCAENPCPVAPSSVSAVYLMQLAYCLMFSLVALARVLASNDVFKTKRDASYCATIGIAFTIFVSLFPSFGFDRHRLFSNYVYENSIYLMHPAIIMLVFCTVTHVWLVGSHFNKEMAKVPTLR